MRLAAEHKLERQGLSLPKMLNADQLAAISRRSTRGMKWENGTIKKP